MTKTAESILRNLSNTVEWCVEPQLLSRATIDRQREQAALDQALKELEALIRTEKLKLLDKFENDCKYNYTTFGNSEKMLQVSGLLKRIEAERTKLEAEL